MMREHSTIFKLAKTIFRFLASLKLAVTLIVLLAAVLAAATFVEAAKGRDYARWYFYTQDWFVALLGMLGVNILAATLIRFPWKLRQFGFVVTHAGLLLLLAGSILTFLFGIDAIISLEEGETSDRITIQDADCFAVRVRTAPGQSERMLANFLFRPGPVDWPKGKSLCLGANGGVKLRVTQYLAHALPVEEEVADPPHARREMILTSVKPSRGDREDFQAAAQVELTAGDTTRILWLQRGDQVGVPTTVKTSDGTLAISYGYESLPLGFSLQLRKFTRRMNPGGMGNASFASKVHLHDEARHIDEDHEISMNEPLFYGRYMFYQSGILPSGRGTVLTVASDPGLFLKYFGGIMTCAGTAIMFVTRSKFAKALSLHSSRTTTRTKEQFMRLAIAAKRGKKRRLGA